VSASKIYYNMYNKQTQDIRHKKENNGQATKQQFDVEGGSDKIRKAEDLADDAFHLLCGTIGGRGCASISSPYHLACGRDHQPRLQSQVLCLSVGEGLLSHAEVHVGLEEQIPVDIVSMIDCDLA